MCIRDRGIAARSRPGQSVLSPGGQQQRNPVDYRTLQGVSDADQGVWRRCRCDGGGSVRRYNQHRQYPVKARFPVGLVVCGRACFDRRPFAVHPFHAIQCADWDEMNKEGELMKHLLPFLSPAFSYAVHAICRNRNPGNFPCNRDTVR